MSKPDGGPFHHQYEEVYSASPLSMDKKELIRITQPGASLRDVMAIAALACRGTKDFKTWDDLATDCYEIADAMLKAREA